MPRHLETQASTNIAQANNDIKSGELAQLMQGPFTRFVQLRRINSAGAAANVWEINDGSGSGWVALTGRHYDPPFVVRGISTNDKDGDGETCIVDIYGDGTVSGNGHDLGLVIRLFAGLDRPYRVTRVHLHNIMQNDDINSLILVG